MNLSDSLVRHKVDESCCILSVLAVQDKSSALDLSG